MPSVREVRAKFDGVPASVITRHISRAEALQDFARLRDAAPVFGSSRLGLRANKFASDVQLLNTTRYGKERFAFDTVWKTPVYRQKLYERVAKRWPNVPISKILPGNVRSVYQIYYNCVTFFRPMIAKYIFSRYSRTGRVVDFCAGWGGRLIGALATSTVVSYTGIDTNTAMMPSYAKIIRTFGRDTKTVARVINAPAEKVDFKKLGAFDCVLTSPPYYLVERYANMPSYPSYEDWLRTFLFSVLTNIARVIDPTGTICINIRQQPTERRMVQHMRGLGWRVAKKLLMPVPPLPGKGFSGRASGEPIYIFKKLNT
jgi:hypothetical protein